LGCAFLQVFLLICAVVLVIISTCGKGMLSNSPEYLRGEETIQRNPTYIKKLLFLELGDWLLVVLNFLPGLFRLNHYMNIFMPM
jgi:hypothetical protein